jgi:hypothetical protein
VLPRDPKGFCPTLHKKLQLLPVAWLQESAGSAIPYACCEAGEQGGQRKAAGVGQHKKDELVCQITVPTLLFQLQYLPVAWLHESAGSAIPYACCGTTDSSRQPETICKTIDAVLDQLFHMLAGKQGSMAKKQQQTV